MRASVVMATYNGVDYLREQIDSILNGMDENDELVVADDGSDDGTLDILKEYASRDARVRLLPDCSHKGVIGNFNYGIHEANGDIVLLADQDDIWFPNKVGTLKRLFEEDPSLTCVLSDLTIVDGDGNETAPSFFALRGVRPGYWKNFMKNSFIGNAMAFRGTMKPYVLPIPAQAPMHDQWIGMINERYGKVLFFPEALGAYRRHAHNVTGMQHGSMASMMSKRWNLAKELHARSRRIHMQRKRGELQ
ncbi:glycosyltransferase family 2 protein [Bifidobacterium animalis]|uniref:Glycosyltransferase, group 2 family protein n=1 Tax=Bifidobacterium animalis subsp. lactis TaxID=302911 RepID=A0A8B3RHC8_BIFAN|nr:glycosyltransferase family 2 protein [Bifidobacterium animalis]RYM93653.1 glycosyltransferase, group 2 family protein [Bifidobacterium animalis subsp. lactis]